MFDSVTPWTVAHQAPLSTEFSRQEHWSGLLFSPPGDLLDPGIEPVSPGLLHCMQILYRLSHQESPQLQCKSTLRSLAPTLNISGVTKNFHVLIKSEVLTEFYATKNILLLCQFLSTISYYSFSNIFCAVGDHFLLQRQNYLEFNIIFTLLKGNFYQTILVLILRSIFHPGQKQNTM